MSQFSQRIREKLQVKTTQSMRCQNLVLLLICATLLVGVPSMQLYAQNTMGGVAGTVKDQTGAIVTGANITLTNDATQVTQTTQSTSTGIYVFESVPVGTYTLKADAPGFKTYVDTGIQVHIQNIVTADVPLVPGSVKQQVTVTAAIPLLQAQDASLGQTISSVQVNDLPLATRNWLSLTELSAGSYSLGSPDNPGLVFANGSEPGQVDFRLNGIDDNNEVFGGYNLAPVPDAIQEFKLQDGNNSAEFGQFAGSVVNASTKSGTNQIHGDLWEYLRNELLNANSYFSKQNHVPRQKYRQNQYGGTVGGPVYIPKLYNGRNKTFFFFDYQYTGITQAAQFTQTIPTAGMRSSNFTNLQDLIAGNSGSNTDAVGRKFSHGTVLDPATTRSVAAHALDPTSGFTNPTGNTVYVRDPFYTGGSITGISDFTGRTSQLNVIPAGRIDPSAIKLLQQLPAPTVPNVLHNNYFATPPNTSTANQYDVRIDEDIRQNDIVWGVFSRSNAHSVAYQPFPGPTGEAGGAQINSNPHYELVLSYTHVFSPEMENEMTGGYDHLVGILEAPSANTLGIPAQYGIQGIPQLPGNGGLPFFNVQGFSAFGGHNYRPSLNRDTALQFMDNLMKIQGSHQLTVGFAFNHIRGNITQPGSSRGVFSFNGEYSDIPNANSGLVGTADFLLIPQASTVSNGINGLGGLSSYNGSNFASTRYFSNYYAVYAQDNWRPTPTLTLNLGIRWEYFSPYEESDGRQANLILAGGNGNSGTYYIPQKGCAVPRSASFNALMASDNIQIHCVSGLNVNQAQKDNFAPRLGFAYRFLPRVVLRGGYGIAYGAYDSVGYGNTMGTNYPFQFAIGSPGTTSQVPNLLPDGVTTATMESSFGQISLSDPTLVTGQNLYMFGKTDHYLTPMTQTVNLTVQDQFTDRDAIQVGYVGTYGRHLDTFGNHNSPTQILPPGVNPQPYAPIPNLARGSQFLESKAVSNYNSLQATYQHQFKNDLVLLANYTYAKCMSNDNGKSGLGSGYRAEWLPGFGIGPDYTLCGGDSTHLVHVSGEYALPFGRGEMFLSNTSKWMDAFIGGWQINYIYTYQSGQPFTVGCPVGTTSDFGCIANLVPGQNPYAGPHNQTQWLNPNAFAQPAKATVIGQTDFSPLGSRPQQVRGPGFYNLDSSVFKNFATGKGTSLQFRIETFNTLNNAQFGNPGQLNFTNLKNFSQITGTRNNNRLGQLALKLFF